MVESSWQAQVDSPDLELKLKLFNSLGKGHERAMKECGLANPYRAPSDCYREVKIKTALSRLDLPGFKTPRNEYEATVLTRFANTRIQVLNEQSETLIGGNKEPKFIRFWNWQ